jgi:hypothetical protein
MDDPTARGTVAVINSTDAGLRMPAVGTVTVHVHGNVETIIGIRHADIALGLPMSHACDVAFDIVALVAERTASVDGEWLDRVIERAAEAYRSLVALHRCGKTHEAAEMEAARDAVRLQ